MHEKEENNSNSPETSRLHMLLETMQRQLPSPVRIRFKRVHENLRKQDLTAKPHKSKEN